MSRKKKHKRNKDTKQDFNKPNGAIISNDSDRIHESDKLVGDGTPYNSLEPTAPHESSNKNLSDNIKLIAYVLSIIVSFFVAYVGIAPHFESRRGKFVALVRGEEVTSSDTRTLLVCLDVDSIDLAYYDIFPIIYNPSKYPLKDVLLKYSVFPNLPGISITDYYDAHEIRQGLEVTNKNNKEETLHPKFTMPSPFGRFVMKDNEYTMVALQATYKGIKEPFIHETRFYTKKMIGGDEFNPVFFRIESFYDDIKHFIIENNINSCDVCFIDSGSGRMYFHKNFTDSLLFRESPSDSVIEEEIGLEMEEDNLWYRLLVLMVIGAFYGFVIWNAASPLLRYQRRQGITFKLIGLFLSLAPTRIILLQLAKLFILPFFAGVVSSCACRVLLGDWLNWYSLVTPLCVICMLVVSCLIVSELSKNKTQKFPRLLFTAIVFFGLLVFYAKVFIIM